MYRITTEGLNSVRLLNTFSEAGIVVYNAELNPPKSMEFSVKKKDLLKVVAILKTMCYNYTIKNSLMEKVGFPTKLGLVITVIVCIIAMFCSNLFVWRVEINGVDGVLAREIMSIVETSGMGSATLKSDVNETKLSEAIREIDGIAAASVKLNGNVLEIDALKREESGTVSESEGNLVAGYDGVITRIIAESGTPLVKVGDIVKKGDVLISNEIFSSADGSLIGTTEVHGKVYADVTFAFTHALSPKQIVYTGNVESKTKLIFMGMNIGTTESSFEIYESVTTVETLYPLPFNVVRTTYKEINIAESYDISYYLQEKLEHLRALYGKEFTTKQNVITIKGVSVLRAYFSAEICIGDL